MCYCSGSGICPQRDQGERLSLPQICSPNQGRNLAGCLREWEERSRDSHRSFHTVYVGRLLAYHQRNSSELNMLHIIQYFLICQWPLKWNHSCISHTTLCYKIKVLILCTCIFIIFRFLMALDWSLFCDNDRMTRHDVLWIESVSVSYCLTHRRQYIWSPVVFQWSYITPEHTVDRGQTGISLLYGYTSLNSIKEISERILLQMFIIPFFC